MKFNITFDVNNSLTSKPTKEQVGRISNSINKELECDLNRFVEGIKKGYSFCPSTFKGSRNNSNFKSQQLFCLDFDSKEVKVTPEDIIKQLELYSITPNVIYTTFSDTEEVRKFRVCILINKAVTNKSIRDLIQQTLMKIVKHSDLGCSDAARLFYPGKEVIHIDSFINDYDSILEIAEEIAEPVKIRLVKEQAKPNEAFALINNYVKKKGLSFTNGNRHNYTTTFSGMCNMFGISEYDCYLKMVELGNCSEHTLTKVNDIYKRYYYQHNTKRIYK